MAFLLFAAWFIISSVVQLYQGAFTADVPLGPGSACRPELSRLVAAVDAARDTDPADPRSFEASLGASWAQAPTVLGVCQKEPGGPEAYLSVLRYRDAAMRRRSMHGDAIASTRARALLFLR